jgi:hypothetical protein
VQLIERVTRLLSMMPAGAYDLLAGAVDALISSPANERMDRLRKMALAAGYKQGARQAMDAALKAKSKL